MGGPVQAGALVIDMRADLTTLKTDMAGGGRLVETVAQKMGADLGAIRKGLDGTLDPIKQLTVNVGSLESQMSRAQYAATSLAKGLLLGAAAGMSIEAIKGRILSVVDSMASLQMQSQKTGSSVENLSKLNFFAKQSGADIDSVTGALGKLSKNMAGADEDSKGAGLAMKYLGIEAKDAAGNLKDPSEMFTEIAKKLAGYEDGAGKVAIAQALLGKSGADMLPTLKLIAEQGDIEAKVTTAQANAARQYQKDVARLDAQQGALFKTIATALLPTMSDFTGVMIDATKNTNLTNSAMKGLAQDHSIEDWADDGAMALAFVIDTIKLLPDLLSTAAAGIKDVGAMAKIAVLAAPGTMLATKLAGGHPIDNLKEALKDQEAAQMAYGEKIARLLDKEVDGTRKAMQAKIDARHAARDAIAKDGTDAADPKTPTLKKLNFSTSGEDGVNAKVAASEYEKLIRAINEKITVQEMEGVATVALTDGEKLAAKVMTDLRDNQLKLVATKKMSVDAQKVEIAAGLEKLIADEKANAAYKNIAKAVQELDDARASAYSGSVAEAQANEQLVATFGMTKSQIEALTLARMEERLAQRGALELDEKEVAQLERMIDAKRRSVAAVGKLDALNEGSDVAKAKELLDILTAVDNATKSAASSMADSFGRVGSAIGGLTTALSGYAVQQQAIAAQLAATKADPKNGADKIAKAEIAASHASAQAQIKSYGDMAHAAKGFFKENSAGYKVLEGTEKAFRAYEMAMAVESMVKKIFFKESEVAANVALNGTKLAGEAATTAASTGLAATEASAWGITAVVKALASLPFPLNLAAGAATLAAVVAIGAKMMGGAGGGSVSVSEQRQAAAGTGSVFGDSSAKSDSIARSIELAGANSSIELTHTAGMLRALISIESSIANLGNILIRSGDVGTKTPATQNGAAANFFSSSAVNGIVGGFLANTLGKVGNAIFGGNVHTIDTGLTADKTTVGQARESGINAYQYTDTKRDGGLFHKDHYEPYFRALGAEANDQFSKVISGMAEGVRQAGTLLGQSGDAFNARLDSFVVDLGKISVKDLKGDEIQAALETVFSKLGDDMAQFAVGGLVQFQRVGEGYLETLTRIAADYANLDSILAATGTTFGATGLSSIAARERLIELTGGIDKLASSSTAFADSFLTEAERLAPVQKYVTEQLAAMGLAGITTRDQYKATVLGLANSGALATEAGAKQYAGLLDLAAAFAKTHAATEDLTKSEQAIADERADLQKQYDEMTMTSEQLVARQRASLDASNRSLFDQVQAVTASNAARDALKNAYDNESGALKSLISAKLAEAEATRKQIDALKLGALSTLSPEAKYAEAKRQFDAASGADKAAMASTFLDASRSYNASSAAYAADYDKVQKALSASASAAQHEASAAQAQLAIMTAQVSSLTTINASVLSVAAAVRALQSTQNAQTSAGGGAVGGGLAMGGASSGQGGYRLVADAGGSGATLFFPGGGTHHVAGAEGMGLLTSAYGLLPTSDGGMIRTRAKGGYTPPGLTLVGEEGPELVNFQMPSHISNATETRRMLAGRDGDEVAGLLREVLAELKNVTVELGADKVQRGAVGVETLKKLDRVADKLDGTKRELARAS